MAKYQLQYEGLNELANEFLTMDDELKKNIEQVATKIGTSLKANTQAAIPKAPVAKHGIHLADDVKMSVKSTEKKTTITVNGGRQTGKLWWIVDNGHIAKNRKFVEGAHFTDTAYNNTDVSGPMDTFLQEVINGKDNE